jgi:hypothetical protein
MFEQLLVIGTVAFHLDRRFQTTASRPQIIQLGRPFLVPSFSRGSADNVWLCAGPNVGRGSRRLIVFGRADDATGRGAGEGLPAFVNQG